MRRLPARYISTNPQLLATFLGLLYFLHLCTSLCITMYVQYSDRCIQQQLSFMISTVYISLSFNNQLFVTYDSRTKCSSALFHCVLRLGESSVTVNDFTMTRHT